MNPLVSIIIPGYKSEKYVDECIQSVLNQTYQQLQIILVDDGSPDKIPEMFDLYASKYSNVESVHRENGGLWAARNTGIEHSEGKYIFFLDSDDLLDGGNAIACLVEEAERQNSDITVGAYRKLFEKGAGDVIGHGMKSCDDSTTADFRFKGFYTAEHLSYNWGKLYRRQFLLDNGLMLRKFPYTQDKFHNMACNVCKPVYAFVDESVYQYRINENSVTFKYKKDYIDVWTGIAEELKKFISEKDIKEDYSDFYAFHLFWGSLFLGKQELQYHKKSKYKQTACKLREYGRVQIVHEMMKKLAKGRYLKAVKSFPLRFMIRGASLMFSMKMYRLYAHAVAFIYRNS